MEEPELKLAPERAPAFSSWNDPTRVRGVADVRFPEEGEDKDEENGMLWLSVAMEAIWRVSESVVPSFSGKCGVLADRR